VTKRRRSAKNTAQHEPPEEAAPGPAGISWLTPVFVFITLGLTGVLVWWGFVRSDQSSPQAALRPRLASTATSDPLLGRNTPHPQNQIGIIAGHNRLKTLPNGEVARDLEGPFDSGAMCEDETAIEANITLDIARRVANTLRVQYKQEVELLGEFDPRLHGYYGAALISLHADACIKGLSGYKVARLVESTVPSVEDQLVNCMRGRYQSVTGLYEHRNTITPDMQEYHAFREIALTTPGAIIELGFLREDQALLKIGDLPVQGVVEGIRCFLNTK
jgi:hypothetical protein